MQATSKVIQDEKDCFDKEDTSMRSAVQKNIVFLLTAKASVAFISSRSTLRQALEKMRYHGYTALPVVADDGTYVGTISEGDFLWHILDSGGYTIKSQGVSSFRYYTVRMEPSSKDKYDTGRAAFTC